ncbi:MAG: hypothetical protein FJ361_07580 [Gemmatimonadetes bacterium]|nr:hypothetical protein [Gemmatimonadota bacterium]
MTRSFVSLALRRSAVVLLTIAALGPMRVTAQGSDTAATRPAATRPARATDTTKRIVDRRGADTVRRAVDAVVRVRIDAPGSLSRIDSSASRDEAQVEWGKGRIAPGDTIHGDLVNLFGDLEVNGVVLGSAVTLLGDLTVHENAIVEGDAVSVLGDLVLKNGSVVRHDAVAVSGEVRVLGGAVEGSIVSGSGRSGSWTEDDDDEESRTPMSPWAALLGVLGTAAVLVVCGIVAVAAFPSRLDTIARRLEAGVGRAFAAGLLLELGFAPLLLLLILGLVITLLGILLIPFATLAFFALYVVLGLLGWFAVAILVGRGVAGDGGDTRGALMRAMGIGTGILLLPYAVGAVLPGVGGWIIAFSAAVTWVAVTAGFGAAALSRGGRPAAPTPSWWPASPTPPAPPAPPTPSTPEG